jgi:ribosomal protein L40E
MLTDIVPLFIGLAMLFGLVMLAGKISRDDPRTRARWDAKFDREARELRRTDATGALICRKCGASGSERAGACPRCGAGL